MRIECPICEHRFDMKPAVDSTLPILCDSCNHEFQFSPQLIITTTGKATDDMVGKPKQISTVDIAGPSRTPAAPLVQSNSAHSQSHQANQRRKKSGKKQIVLFTSLTVLAVVLLCLIVYVGTKPPTDPIADGTSPVSEAAAEAPPNLEPPSSTDPKSPSRSPAMAPSTGPLDQPAERGKDLPQTDVPQTASSQTDSPQPNAVEYSEPKRRMYSKKQLDDVWLTVKPHLLELTTETPFGTVRSTGTLIDSRGWVLASYRAVQGAQQISVSQSPKSIQDKTRRLTDNVRGVLASDPQHDLVILQVNRRFVESLRDLTLAKEDRIVGSQALIQCTPPVYDYPWPTSEIRVNNRRATSELDPQQQQHMVGLGYNDADLQWILHNGRSPLKEGAPLINEQGDLAGMTIQSFSSSGQDPICLGVPAKYIDQLKTKASGQTTPLPLPAADRAADLAGSDLAGGLATPMEEADEPLGDLAVLPKASPRRILSLNLNVTGKQCEQFKWWPTDTQQADDLQLFADHLITAQRVILAEPDEEQETPILRKQVQYWLEQFQTGFHPAKGLSPETKSALNQMYANQMENESVKFVSFATVHLNAMISPPAPIRSKQRDETITFKIVGTNQLIIANTDPQWPPLRPEANCLVLGDLLPGQVVIRNEEGEGEQAVSETCSKAVVYFLFPLE